MSERYTRVALVNVIKSNIDSKIASTAVHVPASTIRQHRLEPSINICAGRPSYITSEQEDHFVCLSELLPDYGFDVTKDVAQLAAHYFQSLSVNIKLGLKWLKAFINRDTL